MSNGGNDLNFAQGKRGGRGVGEPHIIEKKKENPPVWNKNDC